MDTTKLKRQLARCDEKQLYEIDRYCKDRIEIVHKRAWEAKCQAMWERAKAWKLGQVLYSHTTSTPIGPGIFRGDKAVVYRIQPRAKKVWLKIEDKIWWFKPGGLVREDWRPEPVENPADEATKATWSKLGNVLNEAVNEALSE